MDGTNAGGPPPRAGPPGNNIQMRPPPAQGQGQGQGQGNGIARPPHPNARPPPHQQPQEHQRLQQLQPGQHTAQNPAARSPVMSPFHKPEGGSSGSSPQSSGQSFRPIQNSPPGQHSIQIPVRPPGPGGPVMNQQRPSPPPQQQQHPQQRPHPPPGQQPLFANPGRPLLGPNNPGSQGQLRPGGSPQAQPQVHPRPPLQGAPHPINTNGQALRPSASHPNLTGAGVPPSANRFTPPSPSMVTARSPQMRPLQQTQPQGHQPQQPTLRSSGSHPHLAQPRPPMPAAQPSPVMAHQTLNIRPPTPTMQQQQIRPRPPQGPPGQGPAIRPHGHPSPRQAPMQAIQVEIPTSDSQTNGGNDGFNRATQSSSMPHLPPQQRPPRPTILDQMRQSPSQPGNTVPPHAQNPTQRQPQRPPTPQGQQGPFRQGSGSGSPQRIPTNNGSHSSSADQSPKETEHSRVQEVSLNGDHGRPQQHAIPPNQRLGHPPQNAGQHGAPSGGHPGHPQHPQQRQFSVPPSPGQRPLGAPGAKSGPPPQHVRPPPPERQPEPEAITLVEPDAPLSDSNDEGFDDDDIEGGPPKTPSGPPQTVQSTPPPSESTGEKSGPPPQRSGGPPLGPPRGPPKNENTTSRKLSSASGTGPVHILQPSNNPSSPPASAFPPMGQPRPRVRPPPGNKEYTPYRPPERPSQAPVMYGQSGQPAFSQPFPQTEANGSDSSTAQTPLLSQGLESASSSVKPREGALHKRIVANDNAPKAAPANAPPSPKIHGLKGPAILSVSGQKQPSSSAKTLKTWAIRGGLAYLGYTAVFNCAPESTGVRGLYCKATNGVGGLVKPFVAPHYNAHVGPHVDRYVKPVARQGHKIYIKVADPIVQGAFSAAGAVYKSTAKKHVDSAKDQVISILPFPFKSKGSSDETEEPKAEHPSSFEKVSRQPVHADEPHGSVDQDQNQEKPHVSETLEQTVEEVKETSEQVEEKVAEAKEVVLEHPKPIVETVPHVVEGAVEHVHHEEAEPKEEKRDHVVEQDSNGLGEDTHVVVDEAQKGDPVLDSVIASQDSMKKLDDDIADTKAAEEPHTETVTEKEEEEKGHWYGTPDPAPTPELQVDPVPTADEPMVVEQEVEAPEPTPEATLVPVVEETVAEPTPAFADTTTSASEVPEVSEPAEELLDTHVEQPVVEAEHDNADIPIVDTPEQHIQEEEHEAEPKVSHEEHDTHTSESQDETTQDDQDGVVPKEGEHEGEQAGHLHEQQAAHVPEAGDSTGHDEL
ncbi:hypothetical protein CPB97_002099 [Podila verticillata]|nr:hypothetical protein CPB97_002099 [Podila verticillata]